MPSPSMTPDLVIHELAQAGGRLPRAAMQWSLDHWDEVAPHFLRFLEEYADGSNRSQERRDILFFVVHLVGEAKETRAFEPLARICLDGAALEETLGQGVTETLTRVLIGVYDGCVELLRSVIESEGADEFVRDTALEAYSYLAAAGRIPLDEARSYLGTLYGSLQPQGENHVWVGWQQAVARLGFTELADQVAEAFRRELIGLWVMDLEDFKSDLRESLASPTRLDVFERARLGPITGVIDELATWHGFSQEYRDSLRGADKRETPDLWRGPSSTPLVNPDRHIGRNDPCPCGSGKKFKKCCLAA